MYNTSYSRRAHTKFSQSSNFYEVIEKCANTEFN